MPLGRGENSTRSISGDKTQAVIGGFGEAGSAFFRRDEQPARRPAADRPPLPDDIAFLAGSDVAFRELASAAAKSRRTGRPAIQCLWERGVLDETGLIRELSRHFGLAVVEADYLPLRPSFEASIILAPRKQSRHLLIDWIPQGSRIAVVPVTETLPALLSALHKSAETRDRIVLTDSATVDRTIARARQVFRERLRDAPYLLLRHAGMARADMHAAVQRAALAGLDPIVLAVKNELVDEERIAMAMARILGCPFAHDFAPDGAAPPSDELSRLDAVRVRHRGKSAVAVVATAKSVPRLLAHLGTGDTAPIVVVTSTRLQAVFRRNAADSDCRKATTRLARSLPQFSAWRVPERHHVAFAAALLSAIALATSLTPMAAFVLAQIFSAAAIIAVTLPRAVAALSRIGPPAEAPPITDAQLPAYTVLVPLYRERRTVPGLIKALKQLDYPREKLDIKLVVECDDAVTRRYLASENLEQVMDVVEVPRTGPRTKPKALSYAMTFATGELVTIFDAEDRPEPDQLRRVAARFADGPEDLGCIQAELAIDHPDDTWFTRLFSLEYAALFGGLLPWMAHRGLAFPLGGTSNHIKRRALDEAGGWDPCNVTEDADLGIRLARFGWRLDVTDSTTWEEAPLELGAWFAQRVRWYKGWLQTWLVHMRNPVRLYRDLGLADFTMFQVLIGGGLAVLLLHLCFVTMLALYAAGLVTLPRFDDPASAIPIAIHAFVGLAGFAGPVLLIRKCARRHRLSAPFRRLLTLPVYWLLMGVALVAAIADLVRRPVHWAKTEHGLAARPRDPVSREPMASDREPGKSPAARPQARC